MDLRQVTTARLRPDAVVPAHLDVHHALPSGPGTRAHRPRGAVGRRITAALDAAHAVAPDRPGPTLVRRGPDAGNPDPAAVRLVLADRPLDDDLLAAVTALA